jgi:hypothetical protein
MLYFTLVFIYNYHDRLIYIYIYTHTHTSIMSVHCDGTSIIFDRVSTLLAVVWPGYHLYWQHLL